MSRPTQSTPTYLDQLPDAIINIISDYVVCEDNWNTGYSWLNPAACIGSLHKAWPHSRYEGLTKPYMQHGISFNGSAFNLKQIMDLLLLGEPEETLAAQFLVFAHVKFLIHEQNKNPFQSIEEEIEWLTETCTKLGLKVEDMDLDVIWPYKRFELLVQVLDRVTKFCYCTDAHRDSPFATFDKRDVALQSQWQDNNMMTKPAFSTIITPVPSALRSMDQFYIGHGYWHNINCENPYQTLLPVFFLPNIRVIQCSNMFSSSVNLDEELTSLDPYTPHPYTSPVTTLHFTLCDMQLETFEKFLGLPKSLVEFSFRNCTHDGYSCTMGDMVQLLSNYHSESLEILTLDGTEDSQKIKTIWADKGDHISPHRIGSLKDFKTLRVIEAPIWSLVDCDRETLTFNLPEVLPQSLEKIKFFVDMTVDKRPQQYLETIKGHLECMIENKRKKYPRLAIVEVCTRHIARNEEPDWDCLFEDFEDSLAGLAMKENVRLNID